MIQLFGYSFAFLYEESLCLSITLLSYMITNQRGDLYQSK